MNMAYLVLRTALARYGRTPAGLDPSQLDEARRQAARQADLETRVLAAPEARDAVVPERTLLDALAEVRGRYGDEADFADDLAGNGLTPAEYAHALERELRVEAVLDKVGSRAAQVSDIDVELYYLYHPDQFRRPETRVARHVLVTINEELPDNRREVARARIEAVAGRLDKSPDRFAEQALKHSECPTALQGGLLGEVRRGQLYPALEQTLFDLGPDETSGVVESPLGFHLLRCDEAKAAAALPLKEARGPIRKLLESRRRRVCQQAWLKGLRVQAAALA